MRRGLLLVLVMLVACAAMLPSSAAAGPCRLESGLDDLSEGRTSSPLVKFPRAARVKLLFLFVDFGDAPGAPGVPDEVTDQVGGDLTRYYSAASYGRAQIQVSSVREWLRMPRTEASYTSEEGFPDSNLRTYLRHAIKAADARVDFRKYDVVHVINPVDKALVRGRAYYEPPGRGIRVDGTEVRIAAATADLERRDLTRTLQHELGHNLGLPDLYDVDASFDPEGGDIFRFAGEWDYMSSINSDDVTVNAWHRLKLGWLPSSQVRCFTKGSATARLTHVDEPGGTKALVARVSDTRAWVAEVRTTGPFGCQIGVLLYRVDANRVTGSGPIKVSPARRASPDSDCGALANAPFGPKARSSHTTGDGVRLDVLQASDDDYLARLSIPRGIRVFDTAPPESKPTRVLP